MIISCGCNGKTEQILIIIYCLDTNGNYTTVSGGVFSGLVGILGAIPTALGMVIAWPLSNKIGKGKAILFGAIISVIGGAIGFLVPFVPVDARFTITVISFIVKAFGSTPAMYLSIALLGDVMDHQEALHGKRTDGLSMTIYGAIMAGMTGVVTGVLNGVLAGAGYDASAPQNVQMPMLWLFIGGETICYLGIFLLFMLMKVEKFSKLDHRAIEEDQRAKCERLGIEYLTPQERLEREEKEADEASEAARIKELREKCAKKGLNFEEEEQKYQAALAAKEQAKAEKEAAKKAKEAEKEAAKKAKEEALSEAEKQALKEKEAEKQRKLELREKEIEEEFLALREATKAEREATLSE